MERPQNETLWEEDIMKQMHGAIKAMAALSPVFLAGCCHMNAPQATPEVAPVSLVVDRVKDELAAYMASAPPLATKVGDCYDPKGKPTMTLVPLTVTVTLKAVSSREHDPTAGLSAPLGVLSVDPSYSGAYSNSRTQTLVIPLSVPNDAKWKAPPDGEHPLADALIKFRNEIVAVDHSKTPCLQFKAGDKGNFKVSLAFDVVNKTTGGVGLTLAVFKLGDKEVFANEAHQTLDVEMALTGSGQMLLAPAP